MSNSWYRFNPIELTIGWFAGAGASFGCFYFGARLLLLQGDAPLGPLVGLVLLSVLVTAGYAGAMRLRKWGIKLYLISVVGLLILYGVSGGAQRLSAGLIFWLHMGVLPLHLFLFGLPKTRHLVGDRGDDGEPAGPDAKERPRPASYLLLSSVLPFSFGVSLLMLYPG